MSLLLYVSVVKLLSFKLVHLFRQSDYFERRKESVKIAYSLASACCCPLKGKLLSIYLSEHVTIFTPIDLLSILQPPDTTPGRLL